MIGSYVTLLLSVCFALGACNGDDEGNESQAGSGGSVAGNSADVAIAGSPCDKICDIANALQCPNDDPTTFIEM
jgi:hypothetical protein